MKLLNVGCGATRPGEPWTNLDCLHDVLKPGTPERIQLDSEPNYVNFDIANGSLPFEHFSFDGVLISHVIEHFNWREAVRILADCRNVLKTGGILVVSVPNADYFLSVAEQDTPERAQELFGEPICVGEPWHKSFMDYGLFYNQHQQILTTGALRCLLIRAGFPKQSHFAPASLPGVLEEIEPLMNRRKFSAEVYAVK